MRTFVLAIGIIVITAPAIADEAMTPYDRVMAARAAMTSPQAPYPMSGATIQNVIDFAAAKLTWCRDKSQRKKNKTQLLMTHCIYDGYVMAMQAAGAPNIDLTAEFVSGLFAIAEKVDSRRLTAVEADAELATLQSHVQTETQVRLNAAQQAQAAQQAAESQRLAAQHSDQQREAELARQQKEAESAERQRRANAYLWLSQRLLNPPQPPPTTTTTCMPFGTGFQCTGQ